MICIKCGVESLHKARGLCHGCYRQIRGQGQLNAYPVVGRGAKPRSILDRVLDRAIELPNGCWQWTGSLEDGGYPRRVKIPTTGPEALGHVAMYPYRVTYTLFVAEIPEGLELDHLCRNRACINPWHLEPVTPQVNSLRSESPAAINAAKTHCQNGHLLDAANTRRTNHLRICRACVRQVQHRRRLRLRETRVEVAR